MGSATQCAVLFIDPQKKRSAHPSTLRDTGFVVSETSEWPSDERSIRDYHVVVIRVRDLANAPMLAARLRAKPHLGRRVLIALVNPDAPPADRRSAQAGGFDALVDESIDTRQLIGRILRSLRTKPELRCSLPPSLNGKSAA